MNRSIILLTIFLMLTSFVTSIPFPSERNDPLSGFKECEGDFPDTITAFSFKPDPVDVGEPLTVRIASDAYVPMKNGSLITVTGYLNNEQAFNEVTDFCQYFVEQSSECPVEGHFDITATQPTMPSPSDPKDTVLDYLVQISGK